MIIFPKTKWTLSQDEIWQLYIMVHVRLTRYKEQIWTFIRDIQYVSNFIISENKKMSLQNLV